jgi:Tfp pilus assembly protein PilF
MEKCRRVLGEEHRETLVAINNFAVNLVRQDRLAEAEPYLREVMEKFRRVLGEEHPDTLNAINNLGWVLQAQGKLAEAEPYYREAVEKKRRVLGEEHWATLASINNLGYLLQATNKPAEAIVLLTPHEAAARKAFTGSNAKNVGLLLTTLGRSRVALGYDADRFKLAEANLLEAQPIPLETYRETRGCLQGLVDLYTAWDKAEPDKGYAAKAANWKAKLDAAPTAPDKK